MDQDSSARPRGKPRRGAKPEKPYEDFPLTVNSNGQWSKKIRGKVHYFGAWGDWEAALAKWNKEKDYLLAGMLPPRDDQLTLEKLCNRFLHSKRRQADAGELSERSWSEYKRACQLLCENLGKMQIVEHLTPEHFSKMRAKLAAKWGPTTLANEINRIRVLFKWAYDNHEIEKPVRYGSEFKRPSKKLQREINNKSGAKMFEAVDIRAMLAKANRQMKALILLGINCGFGQFDLSSLPMSAVDLDKGVVNFPRPKTGAPRRCLLWPETVEAIRLSLEKRHEPRDPADADLLFVTRQRRPLVRKNAKAKGSWIDSVGLVFGKLLREMGIKQAGLNFYSLRRTFRTIADECKDDDAAALIMGHIDEANMGQRYTQRIGDDRLKAITDHVHEWLYSATETLKQTNG